MAQPFTLVVVKVSVVGDCDTDPARVEQVAHELAVALRGAADIVQATNYDVKIAVDGLVCTEADVRQTVLANR